ncbi:pantoate--beta-alanine ligase [Chloroflexota bacterium]
MEIANTIARMRALRQDITGTVGFVPTMGYLHQGHLSLVREAKAGNSVAVVSIFVNPSQFGPSEDFDSYPRDIERDLDLLKKENTDIVFIPDSKEIYTRDFNSWVEVAGLTELLEGERRPGHFRGVTTIVAKLFNIVEPTRSYFGQKDAQQAIVIKKMVSDLNMNLEIIVSPTIREHDGLAMSSRNIYLDPEERKAATVLFQSLNLALNMWESGQQDSEKVRLEMIALISKEPLACIDYISIADVGTLKEIIEINDKALVSLAVRIGKTRLIDNLVLSGNHLID